MPLGLLAVGAGAGADDAGSPERREVLYVGNNVEGTVSVIGIPEYEVIETFSAIPDVEAGEKEIGLLGRLLGLYAGIKYVDDLVTSPDGTRLYVSRSSLADVAAFDTRTKELLWTVDVSGLRADHFALGAEGRRLYVSTITASQVDVIDVAEGRVVGSFPTGSYPHGIAVSADGERVYVGSMGGEGITVADAETLEVLRTLPFERGVRPFVVTPDERTLYTQLDFLHGLVELDLEAGRKTRTLHLPVPEEVREIDRDDYPNDAAHHGLALAPDGSTLCVAGTLPGYVALVALPELELLATIPVGAEPGWAINSLDGRHCYVSSRAADTVSVISYAEGREVARIPVGDYPQRMWTARVPRAAADR